MHKSLIVLTTLLMALVVFVGCGKKNDRAARPDASPFVVEVMKVKPQPFREILFATGTLRARESVALSAERAGMVREVHFEEGKPVKAGHVMVLMDDAELQAQFKRAQAQLELATATEKRSRELFESRKLISPTEYDQSRANLKVARAEVELIQAQLEKTRIVAPFDGVAGLRQVSVGAYLTPGTSVATLQDITVLKLDFTLPERYLANLQSAQNITFRVAGRSGTMKAKIYALEPAVDVATRSMQVRALAENQERQLLPGAFAEVKVELAEISDAILIPPIALMPGLKEQKVFLHKNGEVEARTVQIGLRTAEALQITSGLRPGEEVITSGILQLRAGMKVQVRSRAEKPAEPTLAGPTEEAHP